jgi:hypothetical protein
MEKYGGHGEEKWREEKKVRVKRWKTGEWVFLRVY